MKAKSSLQFLSRFTYPALVIAMVGSFTAVILTVLISIQNQTNQSIANVEKSHALKYLLQKSMGLILFQDDVTKSILIDSERLADLSEQKIESFDQNAVIFKEIEKNYGNMVDTGRLQALTAMEEKTLRPLDTEILELIFEDEKKAKQVYKDRYEKERLVYRNGVNEIIENADKIVKLENVALTASLKKARNLSIYTVAGCMTAFALILLVSINKLMGMQAQIKKTNKEMLDILDHVKSGFLVVDRKLEVEGGFSKACKELFQKDVAVKGNLLELLANDKRGRDTFAILLEQVFEDILPEDISLDQIPQRVRISPEKTISLNFAPIRDQAGKVSRLLLTIVDVTTLESAELENRQHKSIIQILREMDAFRDFVKESRERIAISRQQLELGNQGKVRAELHTLKGNSAAFGLSGIAGLIHGIEDEAALRLTHLERIEAELRAFLESNADVLSVTLDEESNKAPTFEVTSQDLANLRNFVSSGNVNQTFLSQWITQVEYREVRSLVGSLPEYTESLAERLGKQVKVKLIGGALRVDPECMRPVVKATVHVLRNAIDHGIEYPHERMGKSETGTINLEFAQNGEAWTMLIEDDGRGLDVERIAQKAVERGIISSIEAQKMSPSEKAFLVFKEGVSTADAVSDISGRGVGMGALLDTVTSLGGIIEISFTKGSGTQFLVTIPKRITMSLAS